MRVTSQLLAERFLSNLRQIQTRMDKTNLQMTTGRKFQRPEDDPVGAYRSLRISSLLEGVGNTSRTLQMPPICLKLQRCMSRRLYKAYIAFVSWRSTSTTEPTSDSDRMATLEELREIRGQHH